MHICENTRKKKAIRLVAFSNIYFRNDKSEFNGAFKNY